MVGKYTNYRLYIADHCVNNQIRAKMLTARIVVHSGFSDSPSMKINLIYPLNASGGPFQALSL